MKPNKLLLIGFIAVFLYAAGLTVGLGPATLVKGAYYKVVKPLVDENYRRPDLAAYVEQPCPSNDAIEIATFGQSNAGNTVEPTADIPFPANLIQYDWKSGKCFEYREPLLGTDFTRGNSITYVAVRIANETKRPVVIIPFAFGPSEIMEWAHGVGASQHKIVMQQLKKSGLSPQVFLWHQGESDVPADGVDESILRKVPYFTRPDYPMKKNGQFQIGLSKDLYQSALSEIVERTFESFPDTRFGIALVSIAPCLKANKVWEPLRQAEQAVADSDPRAFISADSDEIRDSGDRYDTCHFSAVGARKLSDQYYASLSALGVF